MCERQEALEPHNGSLLEGINLRGIIARCVKAFHAALYRQYLPRNIRNWFDPPTLPGIKKNGKILFEETKVQCKCLAAVVISTIRIKYRYSVGGNVPGQRYNPH